MENKIVVHMKDGTLHKGVTHDFDPSRETMHVLPAEGGGVPIPIRLEDMKALFFVKDYTGNRKFVARKEFLEAHASGRKAILRFRDGEEIWGYVEEHHEKNPGFFFFPADQEDNNVRIFVIRSSVEEFSLVH